MTALVLNGCGLAEDGVRAICVALKTNTRLITLDLSDNPIGSRYSDEVGTAQMASSSVVEIAMLLLSPGTSVSSLKLSQCGLTDKDAVQISKVGPTLLDVFVLFEPQLERL